MTSWECYENKWFYMKYTCIGKYLSGEILLIREHILRFSQMNVLFFLFEQTIPNDNFT
jgi:hypothetical protein